MKKTENAKKVAGMYGYCKHLRKEGKRMAAKASRRFGRIKAQNKD